MDIWVSALAGAVGGLIAAFVKAYFDSRGKVDESLRATRVLAYEEIWREMAVLPKWPRATDVSYARLQQFSEWLKGWYYGLGDRPADVDGSDESDGKATSRTPGGMFMSTDSRKRYTGVQESLVATAASGKVDGLITADEYTKVMKACSALRSAMTRDLMSRRGAPFRL